MAKTKFSLRVTKRISGGSATSLMEPCLASMPRWEYLDALRLFCSNLVALVEVLKENGEAAWLSNFHLLRSSALCAIAMPSDLGERYQAKSRHHDHGWCRLDFLRLYTHT